VSNQSTGSISGSVRGDTNAGAGIAGTTVEVLKNGTSLNDSNDNNVIATTVTDGSGNWSFNFLPPGTYVIRATPPAASGYKPALLTGGVTVETSSNITDRIIVVVK
jgi:protocatechuate 3,4-dioxygenase beta subunit